MFERLGAKALPAGGRPAATLTFAVLSLMLARRGLGPRHADISGLQPLVP